jgi:hypothetical protein
MIMNHLADWANIIFAILAAIFWLRSALIKVPDLGDTTLFGEGSITDII